MLTKLSDAMRDLSLQNDRGTSRLASRIVRVADSGNSAELESEWTVLGERRLWMCVIMQGIMEQDESLIGLASIQGNDKIRRADLKPYMAHQARAWLASEAFDECCELAGIDAKWARAMSPQRAKEVLDVLKTASRDSEIIAALQKDNDNDDD